MTNVTVLDHNKAFKFTTSPARARILLKQGKAKVFQENPFIVQLIKGENRETTMRQGRFITNWTQFFREEKDIYVQNVSGTQVAMGIYTPSGHLIPIILPNSLDPMNLTQYASFKDIESCRDFRNLINRRPQALRLMTEEEYTSYFEQKAKRSGRSIEEEEDRAFERQSALINHQLDSLDDEQRKESGVKDADEIEEAHIEKSREVVRPRIIGLCQEAHPEAVPRLRALDLKEKLESIPDLADVELEYLRSHVAYKTIKKWVDEQLSERNALLEEDE